VLTVEGIGDGAFPSALSSDELCAAARLAGLVPLPLFDPGWADEEAGVAGAVAVRGLLARGLAVVRETPGGPALTPAVRSVLEPLLDPDAVLEIQRDEGPGGRRRHVLGEAGHRRVLAAERSPSIWDLMTIEEPAGAVVRALAEPLIPDSGRIPALAGRRFTVSGRALARAEVLLAEGGAARLSRMLENHGLDGTAAHALATVLSSARVLVTVRTVRRAEAGVREADAVTWLDAGAAGLWLVTPAEPDGDPDGDAGPGDAADEVYALTAADRETVRDALAGLLGAADLKEERCLTS
jgi:hypothetical protein